MDRSHHIIVDRPSQMARRETGADVIHSVVVKREISPGFNAG